MLSSVVKLYSGTRVVTYLYNSIDVAATVL